MPRKKYKTSFLNYSPGQRAEFADFLGSLLLPTGPEKDMNQQAKTLSDQWAKTGGPVHGYDYKFPDGAELHHSGLDLWSWFAGQCLVGCLNNENGCGKDDAMSAATAADAMLEEHRKRFGSATAETPEPVEPAKPPEPLTGQKKADFLRARMQKWTDFILTHGDWKSEDNSPYNEILQAINEVYDPQPSDPARVHNTVQTWADYWTVRDLIVNYWSHFTIDKQIKALDRIHAVLTALVGPDPSPGRLKPD